MEAQRRISYSVRIDKHLMEQATKIATANDEKMSHVIRRAIRAYIEISSKREPSK